MRKEKNNDLWDLNAIYDIKDCDYQNEPNFTKKENKGSSLLMITDDGEKFLLIGDNVIKVNETFIDKGKELNSLLEEEIIRSSQM